MNKGRFEHKRIRKHGGKALALVLALVLMIGSVAGGTLAWLMDETDQVNNVFTTSGIEVGLEETTENYDMVPGWKIAKDPEAWVTATSEDCYLFIKVEEKGGDVKVGNTTYTFDHFIAYAIEEGWETLNETTNSGVYYKVIDENSEKNVRYNILGAGSYVFEDETYTWSDDEVLTKPEVTKEMMDAVNANADKKPILSFTAYAVQLWKSNESEGDTAKFTAAEAWAKIGN